MKKKENQLSPEDLALFQEAMRQVKPLSPRKMRIKPQPPPLVKRRPRREEEPIPDAPFSDHNYLEAVDSETALEFARPGFSKTQLRALRGASQAYQATLDLHGKTVAEARIALQQFIVVSQRQGWTLLLIIHGKGQGRAQPILKNKLNHWLRESEAVLAFCSARREDGGRGALYLRLRTR